MHAQNVVRGRYASKRTGGSSARFDTWARGECDYSEERRVVPFPTVSEKSEMPADLESWHKAFEMIGPETLAAHGGAPRRIRRCVRPRR